jgi:hypothetical protein
LRIGGEPAHHGVQPAGRPAAAQVGEAYFVSPLAAEQAFHQPVDNLFFALALTHYMNGMRV